MSVFDPRSPADVWQLVRDHPLATIVSRTGEGFAATPLPLVAEPAPAGEVPKALIGHFARTNLHLAGLGSDPRAIAIFHGPQAYVSPRIVSKPGWGPTWNYAVARFQIEVVLTPEENDRALALLAAALEGGGPGAWRPRDMGERYERLRKQIVAFRAHILAIEPTFKLGQDEDDRTFEEIVGHIGDPQLAEAMIGQRRT